MKSFKNLFSLFFLLFPCTVISAQNYQRLGSNQKINGAQAYTLPKAAFQIEMYTVSKVARSGRLFIDSAYSKDELAILEKKYGVDPGIYKALKDSGGSYTEFVIAEDSIKISMVPLPDFTKVFYTYPKRRWYASQSVSFSYGYDGILTDAEASYENRTVDIIFKGISGLASIVGSIKGIAKFDDPKLTVKDLDDILKLYSTLDGQNNFEVYKDLKASLDKRYSKAFAEYFYSVKSKSSSAKLLYCPSQNPDYGSDKLISIFGIDANERLVYDNRLGDDLVWANGMKKLAGNYKKEYKIKFSLLSKCYQQKEVYETTPSSSSYFGYNIPAKTLVSIVKPGSGETPADLYRIPQFGNVAFVNAGKMKLVFQLDPVTGELKKLATESKAVTDDQVGNSSAAIASAISAARGDDADTKLEKEVKRLENEKKKRDLIKELSASE